MSVFSVGLMLLGACAADPTPGDGPAFSGTGQGAGGNPGTGGADPGTGGMTMMGTGGSGMVTPPMDAGTMDSGLGDGGIDNCPNDPNKTKPGQCGCGISDEDGDGDGVANCDDECPGTTALQELDDCGECSLTDDNDNGILDCLEDDDGGMADLDAGDDAGV